MTINYHNPVPSMSTAIRARTSRTLWPCLLPLGLCQPLDHPRPPPIN